MVWKLHSSLQPNCRSAIHTHRTEFMGSLMCPHPRLTRLIVLNEPDPLPPLCHLLFTQHHRKPLSRKTQTIVFANQTQKRNLGDEKPVAEADENIGSSMAVDDFEALISLSSLTFARTVQLQHRARKQRLLKRLLSEAYGSRTRRRVEKINKDNGRINDLDSRPQNKKQGKNSFPRLSKAVAS